VQENIVTKRSDTLSIVETDSGRVTRRFSAPLMEEYGFAPEPYQEFPRGIDLVTFDSLGVVESSIRSNYALFWIDLERWDLKGDVVARNSDGDIMETQQLNWSQKTEKVWSNVQTRLTRSGDVMTGEGFEADQDFKRWRFRRAHGTQSFVFEPNRDTTAVAGVDSVAVIEQ
jgi:LPS export ABC transporter protein LptC